MVLDATVDICTSYYQVVTSWDASCSQDKMKSTLLNHILSHIEEKKSSAYMKKS